MPPLGHNISGLNHSPIFNYFLPIPSYSFSITLRPNHRIRHSQNEIHPIYSANLHGIRPSQCRQSSFSSRCNGIDKPTSPRYAYSPPPPPKNTNIYLSAPQSPLALIRRSPLVACAKRGGTCAGFAGIPCCTGLVCTGIPPGPDRTGICKVAPVVY